MKAYTYNDRLVGVGNDQILGTDQGGGSKEYYAGQYISIDENDVISVTGLAPVSAIPDTSDMATKTWVGEQGYLTSVPEGYATDQELAEAVSAVSSAIPTLPDTEEVEFEELDLSDYALASAVPDAQVNSDWNAASGVAEILNKPTEIQLIAGANVQVEVTGASAIISAQGGGGGGTTYTAGDGIEINGTEISANISAGSGISIDNNNGELVINTIEMASGLQLVAGDGITMTVSGNQLVINGGVQKTLLYSGSSSDSRAGTFTLSQSGYNFDRLEMTLIDVNNYVIKQICEMPADGLVNSNGTRGSSFNSITSGTQTWFKAMNWQLNSAGTTLTYWVDEIATSGNSISAINRDQTGNRPIMLRIYGIKE
jgi:hypothetical protein